MRCWWLEKVVVQVVGQGRTGEQKSVELPRHLAGIPWRQQVRMTMTNITRLQDSHQRQTARHTPKDYLSQIILMMWQAIYWAFWLHPRLGSWRPRWLVCYHGQVINITNIFIIFILIVVFSITIIIVLGSSSSISSSGLFWNICRLFVESGLWRSSQ